MPKRDPRPPEDILVSIATKAANVRTAAPSLSERIEQFAEYLSKMPGRIEAYCYGSHPEADSPEAAARMSLVLRFFREGKAWMLSYGTYHEGHSDDPENPVNYKPLDDAPLKIKLAAVRMFPDLLAAIDKSQDELVKEITDATAEYDVFAKSLKVRVRLPEGV